MSGFRMRPWHGSASTHSPRVWALQQSNDLFAANVIPDPYDVKLKERRTESVCFTGHRFLGKADAAGLARLAGLLEILYARGYRDFLCGGAFGFDLYAAEQVVALRNRHPDARLISCLPCENQNKYWRTYDQNRFRRLLYLSDEVRVLSPFYYEGCMQVRNRYMVDRSSVCVAYMKRLRGGTNSTVAYAGTQDLILLNLAIHDAVDEYVHAFPV